MSDDDNDYRNAFKTAKLEHEQQRDSPTENKRLQAEADADTAAMSDVVLPQLYAAALKLEPLGGKVDIRQYGRTGKKLRPASVAFRITDRQDQQDRQSCGKDHESHVYSIVPQGGTVTVTSGNGFDLLGHPKQSKNVSEEVGIRRRDDVTADNIKKLIMRAIEEYRNDRHTSGVGTTTNS
jgi:hypothetical protein